MSGSTHTLRPVRPPRPTPEERYLEALRAIAVGRPGAGRAMTGTEAQQMAREALIEMGDDWTKRGSAEARKSSVATALRLSDERGISAAGDEES